MFSAKSTRTNLKFVEISLVTLLMGVMIALLLPVANNVAGDSMDRRLVSTPNQSQFVSKNKSVSHRIGRSRTSRM